MFYVEQPIFVKVDSYIFINRYTCLLSQGKFLSDHFPPPDDSDVNNKVLIFINIWVWRIGSSSSVFIFIYLFFITKEDDSRHRKKYCTLQHIIEVETSCMFLNYQSCHWSFLSNIILILWCFAFKTDIDEPTVWKPSWLLRENLANVLASLHTALAAFKYHTETSWQLWTRQTGGVPYITYAQHW